MIFLKIELENGQRVVLGSSGSANGQDLKELGGHGGCVIVTNNNGILLIDATECSIPVKINGQIVTQSTLKLNDVLRIGNSVWKMHGPGTETVTSVPTTNSFRQGFTRLIGLEELKDFKLQHIFSKVFKKHSFQDMEEQLITGTIKQTPSLTEIETSWAKPWLFSRLLLVSIGLTLVLIVGYRMFENPNLLPGLIFIGSFAVPFSTLILYRAVVLAGSLIMAMGSAIAEGSIPLALIIESDSALLLEETSPT